MTENLSVVILNWRRPQNVLRFSKAYSVMPCVKDVHIVNCDSSTAIQSTDKKIVSTLFSSDPGLAVRFSIGSIARTNSVLLVDDDIELNEATVNSLLRSHLTDHTAGAHGIFGRKPTESSRYNFETHYGNVPILLTRALITDRSIIAAAINPTMLMAGSLGGEPFGNGEDIVLSYVARKHSVSKCNIAYDLPYKNAGYDDEYAISVRYKEHEAHRSRVVKWCVNNI